MKNKSQLGQTGLKKKCRIYHKLGHNRKSCIENPSQQGPSQEAPSAPGLSHLRSSHQAPMEAEQSALGPSEQALSQTAPTAPLPPSPPTQPTISQPSQPAQETTRSSANFPRPNTRLKLQSMRGCFWKP